MAILVLANAIEETAAIDLGEFNMDDEGAWERVYSSDPEFYDMFEVEDVYEMYETVEDFRAAYIDSEIIDNKDDLWAFMHPSDLAFTEA